MQVTVATRSRVENLRFGNRFEHTDDEIWDLCERIGLSSGLIRKGDLQARRHLSSSAVVIVIPASGVVVTAATVVLTATTAITAIAIASAIALAHVSRHQAPCRVVVVTRGKTAPARHCRHCRSCRSHRTITHDRPIARSHHHKVSHHRTPLHHRPIGHPPTPTPTPPRMTPRARASTACDPPPPTTHPPPQKESTTHVTHVVTSLHMSHILYYRRLRISSAMATMMQKAEGGARRERGAGVGGEHSIPWRDMA